MDDVTYTETFTRIVDKDSEAIAHKLYAIESEYNKQAGWSIDNLDITEVSYDSVKISATLSKHSNKEELPYQELFIKTINSNYTSLNNQLSMINEQYPSSYGYEVGETISIKLNDGNMIIITPITKYQDRIRRR